MDIQRLKEIFEKQGTFAIVVGQAYTVDEMASALSIYLTLKTLGKDVSVVSAKQPLVEVSNLVGIDVVKPSYEASGGDLIVSFPYQQDEIGKVSYTLEGGLLNIIVKPKDAPLSFGEKDVIFKRSGNIPNVIITVGVKRISELQAFFDVQALKDTTIVNVDKAGNNEGFGDVVVVGQGASSVSEQVANLMLSLGYPMDPDMSQNLMSGIVASTGNFQSPRTSSLAFEMAGILLRNGARREAPRQQSQPARTPQQQFGYPSRPTPQPQMQSQAQTQPQVQPRVQPVRDYPREQKKEDRGQEAPPDWLAPKIFKGSTTVE
jgi:nanoRNase/pAp phosphatase (c-di-AMP/oligoRNAs hydrolase)